MSFTHTVLDFDGRIGRSVYLIYTILNALVTALLIVAGLLLTRPGLTLMPGVLLLVAAVVCLTWVNCALTVKRLHDTGHSGAHMTWIALLVILAVVAAFSNRLLGAVLVAAVLGIFGWLAYSPGDAARNLFGPIPGGARTLDGGG